jgi:hypothetical protein
MPTKRLMPNFMITFAELEQLGDSANSRIEEDSAILETYGIDDDFKTLLTDKTQELKDFPTDEEMEGDVMDQTETKNKLADSVKVSIRSIMVRVKQVFKEDSGEYVRFGTKNLGLLKDLELVKCGFRVVRRATEYLGQLEAKGLTQAMIDELESYVTQFDQAIDDQQDAALMRSCVTINRLILANSLYAMITELYDCGKDYWASRNAAKYKGYVIYDVPPAKKKSAKPAKNIPAQQ